MDNKYRIKTTGTGFSPHVLENIEDSSNKEFLCSCGGTGNPQGKCDGSHRKKGVDGCICRYCQKIEERMKNK